MGVSFYHPPVGPSGDPASFRPHIGFGPPGQLTATPGVRPMELDRTAFCRGTSNATALASRCAAFIHERLDQLRTEPGGDQLDSRNMAVLLKALTVHGASWGNAVQTIRDTFASSAADWREMQRLQTRFLGYGEVDPGTSLFCTDQRATLIGWGRLASGGGHVFRIPLPPSLGGTQHRRRLTATLAWISPVNPRHKNYRQAYLWFHIPEEDLGVSKAELDADTSRRGTVEHRIFEEQTHELHGQLQSLWNPCGWCLLWGESEVQEHANLDCLTYFTAGGTAGFCGFPSRRGPVVGEILHNCRLR